MKNKNVRNKCDTRRALSPLETITLSLFTSSLDENVRFLFLSQYFEIENAIRVKELRGVSLVLTFYWNHTGWIFNYANEFLWLAENLANFPGDKMPSSKFIWQSIAFLPTCEVLYWHRHCWFSWWIHKAVLLQRDIKGLIKSNDAKWQR